MFNMAVHSDMVGKGLGKILIREAIIMSKENNYKWLLMTSANPAMLYLVKKTLVWQVDIS